MRHDPKLTSRAQQLRRNMTKEERRLWYEYLRTYPYQFRRQVAVGNYILDFYCAAVRLAVELDGSQHFSEAGWKYDQNRTADLENRGILVIRFSNTEVLRNLSGVCRQIDMAIANRVNRSLSQEE